MEPGSQTSLDHHIRSVQGLLKNDIDDVAGTCWIWGEALHYTEPPRETQPLESAAPFIGALWRVGWYLTTNIPTAQEGKSFSGDHSFPASSLQKTRAKGARAHCFMKPSSPRSSLAECSLVPS